MMLFSESAIRRYTPPTCTLEIWDKRPKFSRWTKKASPDDLHFKLKFDDPRLSEKEQVNLSGDHLQLELLTDVVSSYVQNLLYQTSSCLTPCLEKKIDSNQTNILDNASFLSSHPPRLQPQGFLTHQLIFADLEIQASHSGITLSASQLFDLLNALEGYTQGQSVVTPASTSWRGKGLSVWIGAVTVAILAVVVPTVGVQWFRQLNPNSASNTTQEKNEQPVGFLDVLPPVPPPSGKPLPSPSLAPILASRDPLPPPSKISPGTPPPRNSSRPITSPNLAILPPAPVVPPAPPKPPNAVDAPPLDPATAGRVPVLPPAGRGMVMQPWPSTPAAQIMAIAPLTPPPRLTAKSLSGRSLVDGNNVSTEFEPSVTTKPPLETTLLDAIPQVAEARQYIQQRWQPAADVKQTLEYRLIVGPDGSLKQAVPLGKAATLYLASTGLPKPGDSFVSKLDLSENQTIRLVLTPNGRVQTFLE
ncbi:DUF4335 domain-containing protein [Aphanothece sacrum]|uniref:DUF4335 domain-containing protein n=1 Tax=Aphanothece sacrum FPU1 TaxID=1920663 RepID=A0A401IEH2_APHSA|nr:DUF4335 domain-containing protein [Aphanothece sacrum]GBF79677.1 hypothetical protein AsFPU1_1076 [Aphanothece sacrum FPU1]GBF87137.1 hypothetical protein AsFPU3_4219 [Aphanothece sacrum FPU3]